MSVERVQRKSGAVWRVRWRENGQPRSRVLGSKRDAELFEADITRRKRLGQLAQIDAGRQTVAEFAREWWRIHAVRTCQTRLRRAWLPLRSLSQRPMTESCSAKSIGAWRALRAVIDGAWPGPGGRSAAFDDGESRYLVSPRTLRGSRTWEAVPGRQLAADDIAAQLVGDLEIGAAGLG